jgi:hypothetical protein
VVCFLFISLKTYPIHINRSAKTGLCVTSPPWRGWGGFKFSLLTSAIVVLPASFKVGLTKIQQGIPNGGKQKNNK